MFSQLPHNSKLLVAISGGPDSVYLLYQLIKLKDKNNVKFHLAHLNHNTRKEQSDNDQKFVQKIADHHDLPLTCQKLSKKEIGNKPSEEKLRKLRYNFLEKTRQKTKCDYIVTAHHMDDQIETIIFNFIRGTGPTGLTGMKYKQGKIVRPLLQTTKEEILKYLKKNKIEYRTDKSNQDINYSRNLIRHRIIPEIKKLNSKPKKNIIRLAQILQTQQDYIDGQTQKSLKNIAIDLDRTGGVFPPPPQAEKSRAGKPRPYHAFSLPKFKSLHPAIQSEIIKTIITPHVPTNKQLSQKTISEVQNILLFSQGGSQKILFDALSISKKNDKIYLRLL